MSTIEAFRATFPDAPGYLDFASFGPLSKTVREEILADVELLGTGRPSSIDHVRARVGEAKAAVADLLGVAADEVTLHPSTSHGLMHAFYGFEGAVLASSAEFPSIPTLLARATDAFGRATPRWMTPRDGHVTPELVTEHLDDDVQALAVSAVDSRTGFRVDLRGLREAIGGDRLLIVDDTQGFGAVTSVYDAADVVCGHAYKWLRAGRGTGFAWFSQRARDRIRPVVSGHAATEGGLVFDQVPAPVAGSGAYQVSQPDWLAAGRLAVAAREVAATGVAEIERELTARADRVLEIADAHEIPVITPREPQRRAGIVALAPRPEDVAALGAALANRGVAFTSRSDLIRIAPHVGTGEETFGLLDEALADFAQKRLW